MAKPLLPPGRRLNLIVWSVTLSAFVAGTVSSRYLNGPGIRLVLGALILAILIWLAVDNHHRGRHWSARQAYAEAITESVAPRMYNQTPVLVFVIHGRPLDDGIVYETRMQWDGERLPREVAVMILREAADDFHQHDAAEPDDPDAPRISKAHLN